MLFKHAEIFTPQGFVRGAFTVEDGRFGEILPQSPDMPGTDLGGARVIPGLIDIHNHGNSGADFSDGDPDGIRTMARYLAKNGVTSFAPASMTLPYDVLARAFRAAADYNRAAHPGCARLMGIQMEGPFFSEKKKGAQNGAYLRLPDFEAFRALYEASEGLLRIVDVAAELPGAVDFAAQAAKLCTVSIAHTDCSYEDAAAVFALIRQTPYAASFERVEAAEVEEYYRRAFEKGIADPEEYAVKNWIVRVQGFLISCATFGFTSNYREIMSGTYCHDLFYQTFGEKLMDLLGDLANRKVFTSETIYRMEVKEAVILNDLMDQFMRAAIKYDDPSQSLNSIDQRMVYFISNNYKNAYHYHARGKSDVEKLYLRILLVTDYICGMTDSYAKRLYQELKAMI